MVDELCFKAYSSVLIALESQERDKNALLD
jgi:hypothetical protein